VTITHRRYTQKAGNLLTKSHYPSAAEENCDQFITFAGREWRRLAEATGMPFHHSSARRDAWDYRWKTIFERVLNDKVISNVHYFGDLLSFVSAVH
jgi:hypothetical protein